MTAEKPSALDKVRTWIRDGGVSGDPENHAMPLMEHLRELRNRVFVTVAGVLVGLCVGLYAVKGVERFVTAPIRVFIVPKAEWSDWDRSYAEISAPVLALVSTGPIKGTLSVATPTEGMYVWLYFGLIGGAVIAVPVALWQLWLFVAPGLYGTERRAVLPLVAASTFLFALGAAFCYFVIFPMSFPFFLTAVDAEPVVSIYAWLETFMQMMAGFGVSFQLPIGVYFLARLGLIDHLDMIRFFRYSAVAIVVIAALLTPPDVLSQILLSVPLFLLYGVGIGVAWIFTTKKREPA